MVTTLDESQVTYLDPAGFITRENGCDMRDATTYKFNAVDNYPKRLYNLIFKQKR
jgi:hypothetical protein